MTVNKRNIALIAALLILAIGFGAYHFYQKNQNGEAAMVASEMVENDDLDLEFKYPGGDDGFVLLEPDGTQQGILKSYLMLPKADYESYKAVEGPTEAPAGMNIFVFALEDDEATSTEDEADTATDTPREGRITRLQNWATDNSDFTSINLAKATPEVVELDGVKALHYQADGLYQQDIYLVSYKERAYMFVGQYNEMTDITYTSFQQLMQSVSFN